MVTETRAALTVPERSALRVQRDALAREVLEGTLLAGDFPGRYVEAADAWLTALLDAATEGKTAGFALLAVGGFGRRELCPGSDLDLVLVHRHRRHYREVAQHIWHAIWDSGLRLDHSVRTSQEVFAMARSDLRVALGLLDARLVAGDRALAEPIIAKAAGTFIKEATHLLPELSEQVLERHRSAGELAFLLEPDLKQSAGGLRDLGALRAIAVALPVLKPLASSVAISSAERVITSARVVVHARTGSGSDRLALEEQDQVADVLGYADADALMAAISEAGRTIAARSSEAWRRARATFGAPSDSAGSVVELGGGIVLRAGEVAITSDTSIADDSSLLVRVALAAAERQALIDQETLDRLEAECTAPDTPWDAALREGFVALLGTGDALIPVVESLDQRRLFELLVPEWTDVRNKPQRNAYHRYTVDRHLLEAVARAAERLLEVDRPDLLLLSALLHDIGKGRRGDHSEIGSGIAGTVVARMGYPAEDVETIVELVAFHLVLPELATRRDLDDPATAVVVAKLVKDRGRLSLLSALTEADGQATGTAAWGPWKAELVQRLVEKVGDVIDGKPIPEQVAFVPTPEQMELIEAGKLVIQASGKRVTVVAPDRPGLLAAVAGALALNGCNVRRAMANEAPNNMAVEIFDVEPAFDRLPDWSKVESDVAGALAGSLVLGERLASQERVYAKARRPRVAHPIEIRVTIDNNMSAFASIIEVRTPDRIGVLHRITAAVADAGLDVVSALVDTLGPEVIDNFYVRDPSLGKIVDPARLEEIRETLESVVRNAD